MAALPKIVMIKTTTYLVTLDELCESKEMGTYPFVVIPGASFLAELKRVIKDPASSGQGEAASILLESIAGLSEFEEHVIQS